MADILRTIETYNLEDCAALGQVVRFLCTIAVGGQADDRGPDVGAMPAFFRADECPVPFSRREWCKTN